MKKNITLKIYLTLKKIINVNYKLIYNKLTDLQIKLNI